MTEFQRESRDPGKSRAPSPAASFGATPPLDPRTTQAPEFKFFRDLRLKRALGPELRISSRELTVGTGETCIPEHYSGHLIEISGPMYISRITTLRLADPKGGSSEYPLRAEIDIPGGFSHLLFLGTDGSAYLAWITPSAKRDPATIQKLGQQVIAAESCWSDEVRR